MNTDPTIALRLVSSALIEARGADAESFLQGQFSNDVRAVSVQRAQLSSYNSPKGRMLAVLHLLRDADALLLELPRVLVEPVVKRLRMFVLRSKVSLTPSVRALIGVAGLRAAQVLERAGLPAPAAPLACAWTGGVGVMRRLGDVPRWSIVVAEGAADALLTQLGGGSGTEADWRRLDLEAGVPNIYGTTQDHFVPQMCNLDALGGISFDKGCYTGQEIVARVHYRGAVKRRMETLRLAGEPPAPGTELTLADGRRGEVVDAVAVAGDAALVQIVLGGRD
ncbi:MAG TPA: folate-binding protein [Verrucomicrobiae bacterium]|nr:folate-binding protein [Verrucomicrobiae bacterium]